MGLEKEYRKFARTADLWISALDNYSDADWNRVPAEGTWTIAQVYAHIVDASRSFGLEKIERCAERSEGKPTRTWIGRFVFLIGAIPPVRAKVPTAGYVPPSISKDEARSELNAVKEAMQQSIPTVLSARGVATHPFLGKLNAREWFLFSEMHMRHHLRQKKRIDAMLHTSSR